MTTNEFEIFMSFMEDRFAEKCQLEHNGWLQNFANCRHVNLSKLVTLKWMQLQRKQTKTSDGVAILFVS